MAKQFDNRITETCEPYLECGLSRSQWRYAFAGLAMQGVLQKPITLCHKGDYEMAAKDSVKMANALLAALEESE